MQAGPNRQRNPHNPDGGRVVSSQNPANPQHSVRSAPPSAKSTECCGFALFTVAPAVKGPPGVIYQSGEVVNHVETPPLRM